MGDLREPPVEERVPLVTFPFRSLLHLATTRTKLAGLARRGDLLLEPGGRFVFDVFAPCDEDIEETDGRWLEREPGIFERADWDDAAPDARPLRAAAATGGVASSCTGSREPEWSALIEEAGFEVEALYGWFDRRPVRRRRGHDLGLPRAPVG